MALKSAIKTTHIPETRKANRAESAEFFGVTQQSIQNWMQRGCPYLVRGSPGVPWVFDLLSIAQWRYGSKTDEKSGDDPDEMTPKERLDWYKGCREKDAYKRENGELIHVDEVTAAWSKIIDTTKARLMALPMRLSPKLVAITDLRKAENAIKDEVFAALEDLANTDISEK